MGWLIIHPLIMIGIYTIIFSRVMSSKFPGVEATYAYSIFVCIGIIHWSFFTDLTTKLVNIFLSNANLIKKIRFPKIVLPIIALGGSFISYAIMIIIFIIFIILIGDFPGPSFLYLLPVILIQIIFSMGLGLYLGILNIFFRDVSQIFSVTLQVWFWATPIVYPISVLPEYVQQYIFLNPMTIFFESYQQIFIFHRAPDAYPLIIIGFISLMLCVGASRLLKSRMGEIIDEL